VSSARSGSDGLPAISSRAARRARAPGALNSGAPAPSVSYDHAKRAIDVLGASVLLAVAAPAIVATAVAIRVTSRGPVLLRQQRLTERGRSFSLLKFRSMVADAEGHEGARFAEEGDRRVTPVGRIIRRTRLDELPQLLNVLCGDMSLIGPRPERPEIAKDLAQRIRGFERRLGARAGLTGLAQVVQGYPGDIEGYRRKLGLDLLYIKRKSLKLDVWIALKTVGVVLTGSGAR